MNFTGDCQLNNLPHVDGINLPLLSVTKSYSPTLLVDTWYVYLDKCSYSARRLSFFRFRPCICNFLATVSVYCSLLNLTLVTIEKYIGVLNPLRYYVIQPPPRMAKAIAAIWVSSLLLRIPRLVNHNPQLPRTIMTFTFPLTIVVTFCCNLKIERSSRGHRQRFMVQIVAIRQTAALNQQRFRGAGTMFFILVTLFTCFVPALVIRFLSKV